MAIEILHGYLKLHRFTAPGTEKQEFPIVWVKGNMISVTNPNTAGGGTLVTVGQNGWSLMVVEDSREIIEATAASYRQVTGK